MRLEQEVGKVVELVVDRETNFGYFLTDGESDVLLHKNEAEETYEIGDKVTVFLYVDSNSRIAATSVLPVITVGQYEWIEVVDVKKGIGMFLNIGIQKDVLLGEEDLPMMEEVWPQVGDKLLITLRVNRNNRIYARLATDEIMKMRMIEATKEMLNETVEGHIYRTSKVGSWVMTTNNIKGFIHESERRVEPRLGEKVTGRIIDVHRDGSVNVSLLPRIEEALDEDAEKIFAFMMKRSGSMPYWDKSSPEDIQLQFQMSKGAFKRALGRLMKEDRVYQEEGWTYAKETKQS